MRSNARSATIRIAASAGVGIILLAGCSSGKKAAETGSPAAAGTMPSMSMPASGTAGGGSAPSSGSANSVSANSVSIKSFAFAPETITVKVGTTVTWTNADADAHTVTSKNGPLNSSPLNTGQSYHYTFTTAGTFQYLCTIHPFMIASVVVTP